MPCPEQINIRYIQRWRLINEVPQENQPEHPNEPVDDMEQEFNQADADFNQPPQNNPPPITLEAIDGLDWQNNDEGVCLFLMPRLSGNWRWGLKPWCLVEMVCRNDAAIAAALEAMAQALANQPNADENAGSRSLATFQRENPPVFKGKHEPDGALEWLKEIERIFRVMDCTQAQKVWYGTHMLAVEADDWWLETRQRLEVTGEEITWIVFRREFMRKYYPEDVRGAEFSKSIKFENGLRSEIKKAVGYQKIRIFPNQLKKGKAEVANGKKTSGGGALASVVCFKCGEPGHKSDVCTAGEKRCFRCGIGHVTTDCRHKEVICFNCGEEGHISSQCQKPKREPGSEKVFALAGVQTTNEDRNAGGAYFISNTFNYYR
ncbi:uncharacterized protein LOC131631263 [Vicia villosa]|uniref:uncharacterized protein LOC131631263 n=1 Tax=Vicia villosa TaxID=3911 RepID=UPI00273CF22E|nr:uncharacterized protein LOC131631263 [Vicia villosa]